MSIPHRCPVCEGAQNVSRFFYEEMTDAEAWSEDPEDYEKPDMVPCRSCNGTGVVWEPPTRIVGDVFVEGNVVALGYREWMPREKIGSLDIVMGRLVAV